jgi:4-amino-4-deoxy-L-arabinose transferase-like glycosyltransferase
MNRSRWIEKLEQWPRWKTLGAILGLALVARLLVVIAMPELGDPNSMDTSNYLHLARSLVETGSYAMWAKPSAYVAPAYPFFLAGVFKIFGENFFVVKLFQIALGSTAVLLIYFLALRFTRPAAALLAALIVALHPELVGVTGFIYTETLFVFLLTATLLLTVRAMASAKPAHFLIAGVLLGLTTLCRGTTFYLPFFILAAALLSSQRWKLMRRWAIFMAGMVLAMAPWTLRNYHHFHVFLPVATGSGDVFWTGNYLEFDGEYRYQETQAKMLEIAGDVDLVTRDRKLMADAKQRIFAKPLPHAWLFVRKIFRYWLRVYEDVPSGEARQRNWLVFGTLAAVHYALLFPAVWGLRRCNWRDDGVKMLLAFVVYYTLVHAATLAVARYRIPLLPLLGLAAAAGLLSLLAENALQRPGSAIIQGKGEKHGF